MSAATLRPRTAAEISSPHGVPGTRQHAGPSSGSRSYYATSTPARCADAWVQQAWRSIISSPTVAASIYSGMRPTCSRSAPHPATVSTSSNRNEPMAKHELLVSKITGEEATLIIAVDKQLSQDDYQEIRAFAPALTAIVGKVRARAW